MSILSCINNKIQYRQFVLINKFNRGAIFIVKIFKACAYISENVINVWNVVVEVERNMVTFKIFPDGGI